MKLYALWVDSSVEYECSCSQIVMITDDITVANYWLNMNIYELGFDIYDLNKFSPESEYFEFNKINGSTFKKIAKNDVRVLMNESSKTAYKKLEEYIESRKK